jgi:hypothetical protein
MALALRTLIAVRPGDFGHVSLLLRGLTLIKLINANIAHLL